MSQKELKELLEAMKALRAENTASPEKARQFLMDEGILAPDGKLAEPYRADPQK
ncbi:hypothetical protein [Roseicella sp. DB1501]|uniref:hypothetical protein n=1 Tax=Roseicella sp. DB1501 TaxID=2730925 RepID=UPI00149221C2|nr:hypothetical protein [Roseicella sp. DB1501]NOG73370.1 hypothetical protein [Roseicella sp. DB1501]